MIEILEEIATELDALKMVVEELTELVIRQQAQSAAQAEILIKEGLTDAQELCILEQDNLDAMQYALDKD